MKFPKSKLTPEIWNYIDSRWTKNFQTYVIDSKYRKSVQLSKWLKEQLGTVPIDLKGNTHDDTMINILRYVRKKIIYTGDKTVWDMSEYWQTAKETIDRKTGDCEDGAILMYILARYNDIPANRLLIMCGGVVNPQDNTKITGHAWLAYKADSYPIHWDFMDWCYYYNPNDIDDRLKVWIDGNIIVTEKYKTLWFGFNEEKSHSELKYVPGDFNVNT
jgi:predicted transglutaminase-like cysteine proteinase